MIRSTPWTALGLAVVLALAACGRSADQSASNSGPPASSGSAQGTTPATPVSVVAIELGRNVDAEKKVTERIETFRPKDTIYASVLTNGATPRSTVGVKWTFEDGQVVDQSEQTISSEGTAATEFHIAKPDGFPAGSYKVEVFVDGSPASTKDFKVTAS